ncbi:hypothetical protein SAMN04515647_4373 [Cohaesibacter sp. ES.047]|nr:hypothetical protein SAMN04515647_4373 [Cohaesibacter sp. ES.047]
MIGAVSVDTKPFPADSFSRSSTATWAEKAVMGTLPPSEFMGEGPESLSLSGKLLPYKLGGLSELDTLRSYLKKGEVVPVMRGDGVRLGTYALTDISEKHDHLQREGVGFVIGYSLSLKKMPETGAGQQQTVDGLLSLFEGLV